MRCRRGVPEEIQSTYGEITTISFSPVHSFKIEEDLPWLQGGKIAVGQFEACLPPETILFFFFFLPIQTIHFLPVILSKQVLKPSICKLVSVQKVSPGFLFRQHKGKI